MKWIGYKSLADITSVVAGTLLDGGGTSGAVTLNVDLSELTDGTADVVGSADELVYLDNGSQKRKQIDEIKLGQFNNDQSWTSNTGDITGVAITGGTNLTVASETGTSSGDYSCTLNVDDAFLINNGSDTTTGTITAGGFTTTGTWTFDEFTSGTVSITEVQDSGTSFSDRDTSLMTAAAIDDRILDYGYTTNTGDITGVTFTTDDAENIADTAGSADFTIAGGAGIDTTSAGSTITITGETSSVTNAGIVELATVAECTTGTDTARAVTPEGLQTVAAAPNSAYHYIHTENKFTATTADEYYFSLTDVDRDVAAGSENGLGIVAIMPATGILKTALINTSSNLSGKTWEWKLKRVPSGTVSTSPTLVATVAANAGPASNTNKAISFVTNATDTNVISYESGYSASTMFSAGDRVLFSQESNSDVSGSPKIQLTLIFQLNETTTL